MKNHPDYYDANYFNWQKSIGEFGGKANAFKFKKSIKESSTVIDFGCGGGFLLKNLSCSERIGIEPNKNTHNQIKINNAKPFSSSQQLLKKKGMEFADVIISNNALEHTLNPLLEIKALYPLLRKGGLIHFLVPCDNISLKYKPNNIDYHLYSWSPMNIGNLFTEAGYKVHKVTTSNQKWPPFYRKIQRLFGWKLFFVICKIYALFDRSWFQVEIIAYK